MQATKLIWAVNVFEPQEVPSRALYLLGALTRGTRVEIQPVFVLAPPHARFSKPDEAAQQTLLAKADARLLDFCEDSDLAGLKLGEVVECDSSSTRVQAEKLLEYAENQGGGAIVVSTHARKGVSRVFMGSFAETLLLNSKIPVFTVNPQTAVRERIAKILFATTFADKYLPCFERTLEMASALGAEVTLFYKEPLVPSPFMTPEIYEFIEREAKARKAEAHQWIERAAAAGVRAEAHLDPNPGYIAPSICEYAGEKNFDLIVMATESQGFAAAVMGSYARQVVREAPCPVCVMRSVD